MQRSPGPQGTAEPPEHTHLIVMRVTNTFALCGAAETGGFFRGLGPRVADGVLPRLHEVSLCACVHVRFPFTLTASLKILFLMQSHAEALAVALPHTHCGGTQCNPP